MVPPLFSVSDNWSPLVPLENYVIPKILRPTHLSSPPQPIWKIVSVHLVKEMSAGDTNRERKSPRLSISQSPVKKNISQAVDHDTQYKINSASYLVAVNLHYWRPSSISASKFSHVTKNCRWLWAQMKGNQFTRIWSVKAEFEKVRKSLPLFIEQIYNFNNFEVNSTKYYLRIPSNSNRLVTSASPAS